MEEKVNGFLRRFNIYIYVYMDIFFGHSLLPKH